MMSNAAARSVLLRHSAVRNARVIRNSRQSLLVAAAPGSMTVRPMSSSPGIFDRVKGSFEDRNKRKQAEKFAEHLEKMANEPVWTMGTFMAEVNESLPTGWRSKIPGMGNTQQINAAKETQKAIQGILEEVGEDATVEDMENLGRKEKLKISLKTDVSLQEMNVLIEQFKGTEIMHHVLRHQKLNGKPIPKDEKAMKALFQTESANMLTRNQKRDLKAKQKKKARGA